jgi:alanyl-tRNA synthetase
VFPQFDRQPDGSLPPLPHPGIDTGAGLERVLSVIQDVPSIWETDQLRTLIGRAEALTGRRYGDDAETDVALRILADHARSMSFLINDGVVPSNEDRGYVLRRLIRRAVRQAYQLGVDRPATPELVGAAVEVMGEAYPDLRTNADLVLSTAAREEARFRATLRSGLTMLDATLAGATEVPGAVAFRLHDTHGFPIELTREIAAEHGVGVDEAGFETAMAEQRRQSKEAGKGRATAETDLADVYRSLLAEHGPTEFVGYTEDEAHASVVAVLALGDGDRGGDGDGGGGGDTVGQRFEVFLDRTPFYAEGGGQVGDTGTIETDSGRLDVIDTTAALPGLTRHLAVLVEGIAPSAGQTATASIDVVRRSAIRRNHTATHLLHWALREVLGGHVKQQGSLVAPDRLRFDFTHHGPLSAGELHRIEDLVNGQVLGDADVKIEVMSKTEADVSGAIAFFDEKYGESVRVISAGALSKELCGGTHVSRLGQIGAFDVISEGSIGSNLRRVEATTGTTTLARLRADEELIASAAALFKARPDELVGAIERKLADLREAEDRLRSLQQAGLAAEARALAASARDGVVVARRDDLPADQLRELATQVRRLDGVTAVVLGGSPDGAKVALVAMVATDAAKGAPELIGAAAKLCGGGGGGKNHEVAQAGGRDPSRLDEALEDVRKQLGV